MIDEVTDFDAVLRRRRMVRHYQPRPVDEATIAKVVGVIRHAPSAGFSQGLRLVVVTDAGLRYELASLAQSRYVERGFEPWLEQAPVHIVLGVREDSYHDRYQESDKMEPGGQEIPWPVPFWWFDAGALLVLLQLAAVREGLGTGFHSPADHSELTRIGELAGFRDDVAPVGLVTLGYPADDPAPRRARTDARRRPLEDLIVWRSSRDSAGDANDIGQASYVGDADRTGDGDRTGDADRDVRP